MASVFLRLALVSATALMWAGCGDDDDSGSNVVTPPAATADAGVCAEPPAPTKPAASCDVTITLPPVVDNAAQHVPEGTVVSYCSNPPSSGPHYPVWADFQAYTSEIPASYLVHDLEHGAVELFYKCPEGCPDVVKALEELRDAQPQDPLCTQYRIKSRVIVAPSSTIPTRVAAAAWGAIYTADCADKPTLAQFVTDHYGKGTEAICAPGRGF